MKLLIGLSAVQTVLLVFLGVRVLDIDARTDKLVDNANALQIERAQTERHGAATRPMVMSGPSADEIREIVHEELAGFAADDPASTYQQTAAGPPGSSDASPYKDNPIFKETVRQDLENYIRVGEMTEGEMADLQQKIARLPADQRREMLSRLTKALNSGELDARL